MNDVTINQVVSGQVHLSFTNEDFNEYRDKLVKVFAKEEKKFDNLKYYFDIFMELDLERMDSDSIDFYVDRSKTTLLVHIDKSLEKHPELAHYRKIHKLLHVTRTGNKADVCLRTYIVMF